MKELLEILQSIKPDVDFSVEKNLITDSILDSFDLVQIITEIEEKMGVKLSTTDIIPENFESVDAITKLILK